MNQRNSAIELSSSFQHVIRQGRVAGKSLKKIRYKRNCFLIRAILMVKNTCMKTNLQHTVKKHLTKKEKSIYTFRQFLPTLANDFSDFISKNTGTFMELLPTNTTYFSRHQAILTFSESYW